jgi:hypothetical protein
MTREDLLHLSSRIYVNTYPRTIPNTGDEQWRSYWARNGSVYDPHKGYLHREDGPAVVQKNGICRFYLHGHQLDIEKYTGKDLLKVKKLKPLLYEAIVLYLAERVL